jgi:hypothetical protein
VISEHKKTFGGLPVRDWAGDEFNWDAFTTEEAGLEEGESPTMKLPPLRNPAKTAFRIALRYDEAGEMHWTDKFRHFLTLPGVEKVAGLVVGAWSPDDSSVSSAALVKQIAKAAKKLPGLRAIFVGDITSEENEISWITQSDLGVLLDAYPALEHFGARGGEKLKLDVDGHANLQTLIIEAGGLPRRVLHQIFQADFPRLEHLELWLGTRDYGADTTAEDLAPILDGKRFPRLRYLGLRNSDIADEIAAVLASAPVLKKIKTLDLSLGTLGDEGARALLASSAAKKLERLDLHHHYCSPEVMKQLKKFGPKLDVSEVQEPDDWGDGQLHRFVAVGELRDGQVTACAIAGAKRGSWS